MKYTFLYVTRNDQYLGDSPKRFFTSLNVLIEQLNTFTLLRDQTEIIVIDWNSDVPIQQHEYNNNHRYPHLKFIHVPPEIARKYNQKGPVSEVHAYNLGARLCSEGSFILRLDQDILVSSRFLQFLVDVDTTQLQKIWWCSRRETHPLMYESLIQHPIQFIHTYSSHCPIWCQKKMYDGEGAVGIFGMSKENWYRLEGYHENMTGWGGMELEIAEHMKSFDLEWWNIHDLVDCSFFHIFHTTSYEGVRELNDMSNIPQRNQTNTWGCFEDLEYFSM